MLCACWHGYQNVVECLVRSGCSLHTANKDGELPLHVAAVRGNHNIVQFLSENGADLDATDNVSTSKQHPNPSRHSLVSFGH